MRTTQQNTGDTKMSQHPAPSTIGKYRNFREVFTVPGAGSHVVADGGYRCEVVASNPISGELTTNDGRKWERASQSIPSDADRVNGLPLIPLAT